MDLPKHKAGLFLTHNEHKGYYQTAEELINERFTDSRNPAVTWATETSRQRCIETNELWELQWYPETPVSFYLVVGATLEEVLTKANESK